jgi:hypothetical protein
LQSLPSIKITLNNEFRHIFFDYKISDTLKMSQCKHPNTPIIVSTNPKVSCNQQFHPQGLPPDYILCNIQDTSSDSIYLYFYSPLPNDTPFLRLFLTPLSNGTFIWEKYNPAVDQFTAGTINDPNIKYDENGNIIMSIKYEDRVTDFGPCSGYHLRYTIIITKDGMINSEKTCVQVSSIKIIGCQETSNIISRAKIPNGKIFYNNENFSELSINNHKRLDNKCCRKRCRK